VGSESDAARRVHALPRAPSTCPPAAPAPPDIGLLHASSGAHVLRRVERPTTHKAANGAHHLLLFGEQVVTPVDGGAQRFVAWYSRDRLRSTRRYRGRVSATLHSHRARARRG
jgi:hypothetical protein